MLVFKDFFKTQSENIHQNAPNFTTFSKFSLFAKVKQYKMNDYCLLVYTAIGSYIYYKDTDREWWTKEYHHFSNFSRGACIAI